MKENLVIGAGLSGLTIAHALKDAGEGVTVWEETENPGGFARDKRMHLRENGKFDLVHEHGPHIFHTEDKRAWEFLCRFDEMVPTTFSSLARYESRLYPVPVNLLTFSIAASYLTASPFKFLNPHEVEPIRTKRLEVLPENCSPQTFEGVARNRVGDFLYLEIFKNYTEAFWGRPCNLIPGFIAERIPVRFNLDSRYHKDTHDYVGVPRHGYSWMFERMARGLNIAWGARPWLRDFGGWKRIFFTGDPSYLIMRNSQPYRGFDLDHAVESRCPWQQIIDNTPSEVHRSFCSQNLVPRDYVEGPRVVSYMHPIEADLPAAHHSAAYPLPWNRTAHERMLQDVRKEIGPRIRFAGRKALYKYLDMDRAILEAWATVKEALS